jgi:glucose-6-phosphate 1-dehydrogenase
MPTTAPSCAIVIFGASGDLAKLKLIPAIYEMARERLLNEHSYVVGFARSKMSEDDFRKECNDAIRLNARSKKAIDEGLLKSVLNRIHYFQGDDYGSAEAHQKLSEFLTTCDGKYGNAEKNRLFYLSTPPNAFEPIITRLGERAKDPDNNPPARFKRLIIEKPFGTDLASAKHLNAVIHKYFDEEQVFRIDHYLGKETVQNLMVMRFANSIFEPIWNYKYIDHVQITVSEIVSADDRAGYYDNSGALRDMVQNHIFQLMALVAMEPPAALDAVSIRDEKTKVYRSIRPIRPEQVDVFTVRGQYGAGTHGKVTTNGYTQAKGVKPGSGTETFVALKLFIDNWRWSGMPFYIRTGKLLEQKLSEVVVRFRSPPQTLFQKQCESPVYPNDLVIRIAPEEGISWRLNGKVPGGAMNIKPVALDFNYKTAFKVEAPEAYERLIYDAMVGDQTLFIRGDEAEAAWAVIDPIELGWRGSKKPPEPYAPGSWGPKRAMDLIEHDGRRWMQAKEGESEPIVACSL